MEIGHRLCLVSIFCYGGEEHRLCGSRFKMSKLTEYYKKYMKLLQLEKSRSLNINLFSKITKIVLTNKRRCAIIISTTKQSLKHKKSSTC